MDYQQREDIWQAAAKGLADAAEKISDALRLSEGLDPSPYGGRRLLLDAANVLRIRNGLNDHRQTEDRC